MKISNLQEMRPSSILLGFSWVVLFQPSMLASPANPRAIDDADFSALQALFPQQIVLREHTFWVELPQCGACLFVPIQDLQGSPELSFHLIRDGHITYSMPQPEHDFNWSPFGVLAVAFTDLDSDGNDDITILSEYVTGIGPQGAVPFPGISIYYNRQDRFTLDVELSQTLTEQGIETIGEALEFLDR